MWAVLPLMGIGLGALMSSHVHTCGHLYGKDPTHRLLWKQTCLAQHFIVLQSNAKDWLAGATEAGVYRSPSNICHNCQSNWSAQWISETSQIIISNHLFTSLLPGLGLTSCGTMATAFPDKGPHHKRAQSLKFYGYNKTACQLAAFMIQFLPFLVVAQSVSG